MPDYQNGKIYKITNDVTNDIYIGSTCRTLNVRLTNHKAKARLLLSDSKMYITMREIGTEHFEIELIEDYPCNSKSELLQREDYYITEIKPSLNTKNAVMNHEKRKIYRDKYVQENREKINQKEKKYRQEHKDKVKRWQHNNYLKNKVEKLAKQQEVVVCECGDTLTRGNMSRHRKGGRHLKMLNKNNQNK